MKISQYISAATVPKEVPISGSRRQASPKKRGHCNEVMSLELNKKLGEHR